MSRPDAPQAVHAVEAFGVRVDVTVGHRCGPGRCIAPDLDDEVHAFLPPGARSRTSNTRADARFSIECADGRLTVVADGNITHHVTAPEALHQLDGAIRTAIAVAAPGLVFVHAGAVAVGDRAIVLPGRSMSGKTSLVAALVRSGATYLSDEYAVLDADGLVHPYARRLSVRTAGGRDEVPVADLGGTSAAGPRSVALIAAITYRPGAAWSVRRVDPVTGAEALIANAVAARARAPEVLRTAGAVARRAVHVAGERGEAALAGDELLRLLAEP